MLDLTAHDTTTEMSHEQQLLVDEALPASVLDAGVLAVADPSTSEAVSAGVSA